MAKRLSSKISLEASSLLDSTDCTKICNSELHAEIVLSSAYLGNLKLVQHCCTVCSNYLQIRDVFGRNALHVAASKGHSKLLLWLLSKKKVKVNLVDLESKWSALHRSIFYGHLGVSVLLVKWNLSIRDTNGLDQVSRISWCPHFMAGGDPNLKDNGGSTPLSILNEDRELFKSKLSVGAVNVYTWGSNSNVTLGHDHSRKYPEKMEFSLNYVISQVVLCKFHSVFLTDSGKVLTCGHGLGGRLGNGTENSLVVPCLVKAVDQFVCVSIAAARNHTVMLTKSGSVLTCGLNDAHQLGQGSNPSTAPANCVIPKPVRAVKNKIVIGIGAGRYHTAFCTTSELYTMGRNLGQLGYVRNYDTQVSPQAVLGVNLDPGDSIIYLSASDAATACLTKKNRVFVCTEFIVKTIRLGFLEKASCLQFSVCASLSDLDHLRKVESEPAKVLVLDSNHNLWYWEPVKKGSVPNHIPGLARHKVSQFCLGRNLSFVTKQGEVYSGPASFSNRPVQFTRLLHIQNAQSIFIDFKTANFAYAQQVYRPLSQPQLSECTLTSDLIALLEEACLPGSVSDIEIEVGNQVFVAHQFLLGSASSDLTLFFKSSADNSLQTAQKCQHSPTSRKVTIPFEGNSSVFKAFLHYLYGSHICLLPPLPITTHSSQPHTSSSSQPRLSQSLQVPPSQNGQLHSEPKSELDGLTSSTTSLDDESTPDTSFTSLDENDLTTVYDQFASSTNDQFENDIQIHSNLLGSTPKKKSVSTSLRQMRESQPSVGEPQSILQLVDLMADLKALLELATRFGLVKLKRDLEELLSSLTRRKLLQSLVLVSPKPNLNYNNLGQFSDLILKSRDEDLLHCHRCVLVARSDYFRSMLLMGWRESSDDVMFLSLPVATPELKAVLDYLYTDYSPTVTGSTSMEWIISVLVVADQLLLTRLKDLCEKTLTNLLTLRNVAEVLELAEAYSAGQLKRSCLHFISVNAACLLEGRHLDNVDPCLLDELSTTYQQLAPSVANRVIRFSEPKLSSLPESYFLEDTATEDSKVNKSDSSIEDSPIQSVHDADSAVTPTGNQVSMTPKTLTNSSGSHKRRRRKNSQSESKRNANSSRFSQSPPSSPADTTPNANPLSATPFQSIPKECNSGQGDTPLVESGNKGSSVLTPDSDLNGWTEKVVRSGKKSNKARTKLVNRFNASPDEKTKEPENSNKLKSNNQNGKVDSKSDRQNVIVGVNIQDASSPVKKHWAQTSVSTSGPSDTVHSLREIMAREEQSVQRIKQNKSKSPPPDAIPSHPVHMPISIPIKNKHPNSQESPLQSPSLNSQSPSVNPWKKSVSSQQSTPPAKTMRELMMEAEADQQREMQQQKQAREAQLISTTKVVVERNIKHLPAIVPHQQVSFASIIRSQELEQGSSRVQPLKPLPLIQIEERAILELKELYHCQDNPDEYITVETVPSTSCSMLPARNGGQHSSVPFAVRVPAQVSPWGRDPKHVT